MKLKNFTRQEILELPEGIRIRMSAHSNCAPEYKHPGGRLILQTENVQEDDEELFGLYGEN